MFLLVYKHIRPRNLRHYRRLSSFDAHRRLVMTENDPSRPSAEGIPSVMKAAQQTNYGDVRNVLSVRDDVPVPRQLSAKQVLVRVHAASINPADWKMLYGHIALITGYSFPRIPGSDLAGVVVDVGADVRRFRLGDEVYGTLGIGGGSYAEYARADESMLALKPTNLSMEEAAAIPLAAETSYGVLFHRLSPPVGRGTKIFICGGSSGTGHFAIQLAKAAGATVATTCSERNFPLMERLGYRVVYDRLERRNDDEELLVIDRKRKDFGEELRGENFDAVYDCVGGEEQWISAQKILKPNGHFITIAGDDTQSVISVGWIWKTLSNVLKRKFWSIFSSAHHGYTMHTHFHSSAHLDAMRVNYFQPGKVKPLLDTVFDWRVDGAEALHRLYERSRNGPVGGKLIVKIAD